MKLITTEKTWTQLEDNNINNMLKIQEVDYRSVLCWFFGTKQNSRSIQLNWMKRKRDTCMRTNAIGVWLQSTTYQLTASLDNICLLRNFCRGANQPLNIYLQWVLMHFKIHCCLSTKKCKNVVSCLVCRLLVFLP